MIINWNWIVFLCSVFASVLCIQIWSWTEQNTGFRRQSAIQTCRRIVDIKMTTVHPLSQFNLICETRPRVTGRPCRKESMSSAAAGDVTGVGLSGEPTADQGELLSSLSPLMFCMKLFGLYFDREGQHRRRTGDPEWNPAASATRPQSTWLRVYASVLLVCVWVNAARLVLMFNQSDRFGPTLLMKTTLFTWSCLTAVFHTAYYHASHSGQLLKILTTLPVTRDTVSGARRVARTLTALVLVSLIANSSVAGYIIFTLDSSHDYIFAPLVTHIRVPENKIKTAKIAGYLGFLLLFPGVFFAHSMSLALVFIFYSQFKKLKKNFRRAVQEAERDVSLIRRRHQTLSRAISKLDSFMRISNVAGFVFHVVSIIVLLYIFIFDLEYRTDYKLTLSYLFLFSANVSGLLCSASAGIVVNHMVRMHVSTGSVYICVFDNDFIQLHCRHPDIRHITY